jgi:branched-chain amino acid transport system permease protein
LLIWQALTAGILLGGVYAAIAIGLGLVWGVMKILNIAHAALALLGAYLTVTLMQSAGIDPLASLVISVPVLFALGALTQRLFVSPLIGRRDFETQTFLMLYGIMVVVENLSVFFWKTDVRLISPSYANHVILLAGAVLPVGRLIAFGLGTGTVAVVYLFLRRSRLGLAVRALGFDREAAGIVGINVGSVSMLAFGIGTATAAVAGVCLGLVSSFFPGLQIVWISKAFLIVVLGGIGNIPGLLLAAITLGVLESVVGVLAPAYVSNLVAYVLLIVVLMVRPQGLLGSKI